MPLNLTPLPTTRVDGDANHTAGHNATNVAVNAIGDYVDDVELPFPSQTLLGGAGRYMFPISQHTSALGAANSLGNNVARITAWHLRRSITIDRMGGEIGIIGEAGSVVRWFMYTDRGDCYPDDLLLDAGTIDGSTLGVKDAPTLAQPKVIPAGVIWIGGANQLCPTTQPVPRTTSSWFPEVPILANAAIFASAGTALGYLATGINGAMPAKWPSTLTVAGGVARPHVKVVSIN